MNSSTVDGIPKVNKSASQFKETYIDGKLDGTASVKMTIEEDLEKPMYTSVITYNPGVILYQVSDNSTSNLINTLTISVKAFNFVRK